MPGMRRMLARTPARPRWRTAASASTRRWARGVAGATGRVSRTSAPAQSPYTPLVDAYASDTGKLRMRSARASASVRGSRHHASRPPPFARRWGQVQHPRSQPSQAAQRGRLVQVSQKRRDRHPAQSRLAFWAGGQGHHPHAASTRALRIVAGHAHAYIAATHNQQPLAAETRGQGAQATGQSHGTHEFFRTDKRG